MRAPLVALAVVLCGAPLAANWPQWRGPAGLGVSAAPDPPTTWSATRNIAWRAALRGLGSSSPIDFVSRTGETIVVKADRTPDVVARNDLGERLVASPAISGGRIFLRSDGTLWAVGSK